MSETADYPPPHSPAQTEWQLRIAALQAELAELQPRLIDAEARLAEQLAAINAFEFRLRARLGKLADRLDALQTEVGGFRRRLRQLEEDWFFEQDGAEDGRWRIEGWDFAEEAGAAAQGAYRYMGSHIASPAERLSDDKQDEIKKLYRQLARRFHPDFALDDADRQYRTDMMMQINAAYAAADLARLQQLTTEPDSPSVLGASQTPEQLAEALQREIERCRQRLQEIEREFKQLERHRSARLLVRVEQAQARGRDLLAEMEMELRERIAHKMVERDVLQEEIASFGDAEQDLARDTLADTMLELGLEQVFEDDPDSAAYDWHSRRTSKFWHDDDLSEDMDEP